MARAGGDEESGSGSLRARDKGIATEEIAQWHLSSFGDTDARRLGDIPWTVMIVSDPQAAGGRSEIAAIVPGASDTKCLAEPSGAGRQFRPISQAINLDVSRTGHFFHSGQGLQGAKEDRPGLALRFAGHVQAIMVPIDEVDVGMTGGTEEHGIAQGGTGGGMSGWIIGAEISFDFNYACDEWAGFGVSDEDLAQKLRGDAAGVAGKEGALQGLELGRFRLRASHVR